MEPKSRDLPVSVSGSPDGSPSPSPAALGLRLQQQNRPSLGGMPAQSCCAIWCVSERPLCSGLRQSFSSTSPPTSPPSSLNKVAFYKQVSGGRQGH